jgi:hypothetical protein
LTFRTQQGAYLFQFGAIPAADFEDIPYFVVEGRQRPAKPCSFTGCGLYFKGPFVSKKVIVTLSFEEYRGLIHRFTCQTWKSKTICCRSYRYRAQ